MARFGIDRLNYMTAGRNRIFLNVDRSIDTFLSAETVMVRQEQDESCLVSLDPYANGDILKTDTSSDSDAMYERIRWYNAKYRQANVSFDLELSQTDGDTNTLRSFHPMYDMTDVHVKSASMNRKDNFLKFDDQRNESEDVYEAGLSANPIQFCRVGQRTYMMTEPTKVEADTMKVHPDLDDTTGYYVPGIEPSPHRNYLYPSLASLSADSLEAYFGQVSSNPTLLQRRIDGYFSDAREVSGMAHNHVLGLYHRNTQRWLDRENETEYQNGNVYADLYALKNEYDSSYSVSMSSESEIDGCRQYGGMNGSRGSLYLKFQDDITYSQDGSGTFTPTVPARRTWQKVERFQAVNLGLRSQARHKSTFFSVRLRNTDIDAADARLSVLMNDIQNSIRNIAQRFAPAHTQLLEVQVES